MLKKNKRNKISKNIIGNSLNGISYAIEKEHNLIYIMSFIIVVLILAVLLKVNSYEVLAILITSGITFSIELINTAIEAVTDLVTTKDNELAKISKDASGASLFIMTIVTIITVLIIFVPKILALI